MVGEVTAHHTLNRCTTSTLSFTMLTPNLLMAILALGAQLFELVDAVIPTVTVASGVIVGTTTSYAGSTATNNKFIGVPFAKSPPLRFGLPEPAAPWKSPLEAITPKPACLQLSTANISVAQSEDCLYLNIYTPAGTTSTSKKSVLFWIFGGDLTDVSRSPAHSRAPPYTILTFK